MILLSRISDDENECLTLLISKFCEDYENECVEVVDVIPLPLGFDYPYGSCYNQTGISDLPISHRNGWFQSTVPEIGRRRRRFMLPAY